MENIRESEGKGASLPVSAACLLGLFSFFFFSPIDVVCPDLRFLRCLLLHQHLLHLLAHILHRGHLHLHGRQRNL
jgi:hypothetical protein